jgi:glycosyltransferase involved in cell wall biosynthesis
LPTRRVSRQPHEAVKSAHWAKHATPPDAGCPGIGINMKTDTSVIILTYNESIHLDRCIRKVRPIANDIFVVDSFSTDDTVEIARKHNCCVYQNKWEKNYARQFNWALNNLPIKTEWVLRLDADEYLTDELILEIQSKLSTIPQNVTGIVFKRRHFFFGKWIKRGTYPVKLLRLFRYKKGYCEQRWMDEHITLTEGADIEFEYDFVDHNLNNLSWWLNKHVDYSIREAVDMLDIELSLLDHDKSEIALNKQAEVKRHGKTKYTKLPLFWRSSAYFVYRYIMKFGFSEGAEGFLWHFFQGLWYRTLVDSKIYEIKKECGTDPQKIKKYLKDSYNLQI